MSKRTQTTFLSGNDLAAERFSLKNKMKDYVQFLKLRLSSLVVFSSLIGFLIASGMSFSWLEMFKLVFGGFLVVGASNGINQLIEHNSDKLMTRTLSRPVASGRMSLLEGSIIAVILGVLGLWILSGFNMLTGILALVSLLSYAFVYTPLKKVHSIAVTIGALPGALPVLIGYTAFAGSLSIEILFVFGLQFIWQYPHFWAIAWQLHDDYSKAGIRLLPLKGKPDKSSARLILLSTALLIPTTVLMMFITSFSVWGLALVLLLGIYLCYKAYLLFKNGGNDDAKALMLSSFIYLPLVQIILLIAG